MNIKCIGIVFIVASVLSSCLEKDISPNPGDNQKSFNGFDFSTVEKQVSLEVNYLNSEVLANTYFELYDEMPVTEGEYSYTKREDVTPLFAAYTADNGIYKGNIELPSYLKKVYIYSPAFFAKTLIEADVVNGAIVATDEESEDETTRSVSPTNTPYNSYMAINNTVSEYQGTRWKTWLGEYNLYRNGEIDYKYRGTLSATAKDGLYAAHTQVINTNKACPPEFRSYSDMYINEDAEIVVTFLGQNTCWNCSMGYYYYKNGEKPSSLNEANVIMLFPNTQDGGWTNGKNKAKPTAGIDRLSAVQLKYYPNIANGSKEGETYVFPAGYRVGLVIANNAWANRISGFNVNKRYRAATSEGLSVDNKGYAFNSPRTAVYRYGDFVMVSFEDHTDDENFSDIVVALKSNPVEAVTEIPVVDPSKNWTTVEMLKGIYAFEDMWPYTGDYDMNDVLVRYNYIKTFDKENKIHAESFIFKTFQNFAENKNGLAFVLDSEGTPSSVSCFIRKKGESEFAETSFAYENDDKVYILTDNVKENMGAEYKISVTYDTPAPASSEAKPFIFRNEATGKRLEVHLPKEAPTSRAEMSYFGTNSDASKPLQGIYYVREGNYPFAFFLSGATEKDLSKLLDWQNEETHIDILYKRYSSWVSSNGANDRDWYKE